MNTTSRQVKNITGSDCVVCQYLRDGTISNAPMVFFRRYLLFETSIEMTAGCCLDDIPHLALAHLSVFAQCHLVVGMNLNTQVALSINELHQQRQLTTIFLIDRVSENLLRMFCDDSCQQTSLECPVADNARTRWNSAHLPALTYQFVVRFQAFIWPQLVSTPHDRM